MERVKWTDRIRNEAVLERVGEEIMMLKLIRKRKRNCLGHWLRRNCLLKDALEVMVNGRRVPEGLLLVDIMPHGTTINSDGYVATLKKLQVRLSRVRRHREKQNVQRCWRVEFGKQQPTRLTITRMRDKFEVDGTVQDVLKGRCGRKRSSTDNECVDAVMQAFAQSPEKSMRNVINLVDKFRATECTERKKSVRWPAKVTEDAVEDAR
ncbi:hypothetical protein ANN_25737 [Periplaneta americana]|uniref:DUF4817 domain-containing protein n=1 Tax=Periplaneta americana TaxID=6978 RepID=A0ABQ8S3Z5_PERAM|nr:hypothetical protein ANN_25737 [Periplaneta americana]